MNLKLRLTIISLANHEMRLVLASMIWNFDLELCEESESWLDQKVYILWVKGPLMVKLKTIRGKK